MQLRRAVEIEQASPIEMALVIRLAIARAASTTMWTLEYGSRPGGRLRGGSPALNYLYAFDNESTLVTNCIPTTLSRVPETPAVCSHS